MARTQPNPAERGRAAGGRAFRRLGGVLAALVLGFFTVGPGLDGLLCHPGVDGAHAAVELAPAGHADHESGEGVCLHGACHHAAPFPPDAPQAVTRAAPSVVRAAPPADLGPTFDLLYGLERPPRA